MHDLGNQQKNMVVCLPCKSDYYKAIWIWPLVGFIRTCQGGYKTLVLKKSCAVVVIFKNPQ